MFNAAEALPKRIPSLLLPSGVQTELVLVKGEELNLECIPEGLYVSMLYHQDYNHIITELNI